MNELEKERRLKTGKVMRQAGKANGKEGGRLEKKGCLLKSDATQFINI